MIGKVTKGSDFGGLSEYLTRNGRGDVLEMRNLSSDTPAEAAAEMQLAASMSTRTKQPVMHISVRTAPGDPRPSDDDMCADAGRVLASIGLQRNQAMIVRHGDDHFHIAVNRVGPSGKTVSDSHSYAKIEKTLREIENERGLIVVQGRHAPDADGQRMTGPRTSRDPRQHTAPASVRQTLLTARNREELDSRLARDGWRIEIAQKPGKRPGAVLVGPDGQRVGAGKIDRDATLSKIDSRFRAAAREEAEAQKDADAQKRGAASGLNKLGRKLSDKKKRMNSGVEVAGQVAAGVALLGASAAGSGRRRRPGQRPGRRLGL